VPSRSVAQRRLFAVAEHHPEELYAKNAKLADLPQKTLHDFAATKEKGLPQKVKKPKAMNRYGMIGR
jgi:hypothetical protein